MKCLDVLKKSLQFLLIVTLLVLTYFRLEKLFQEETSLSYSTVNSGLYLPSLTTCFRSYTDETRPKMDTTMNFKDFMENFRSVKDILNSAVFKMYGQNDKIRWAYDILKKSDDYFIEETFYLVAIDNYYGLNRCITINAPIEEPVLYKDSYVSMK